MGQDKRGFSVQSLSCKERILQEEIAMEKKRQWNLKSRIAAMAILAFALFLAGCGKETSESEEPSVERTEKSTEQMVSADTERAEETSGRFQYDYTRLYGGMQGLPVIEEKQAMAEGKTLLTLQTSLTEVCLTSVKAS